VQWHAEPSALQLSKLLSMGASNTLKPALLCLILAGLLGCAPATPPPTPEPSHASVHTVIPTGKQGASCAMNA
jgi:hypothetical protein